MISPTHEGAGARPKPMATGEPRIEPKRVPYAFAKRAFDLLCASVLLLLLAPVMMVLAVLVKMTSKGPAFYRSTRIGLGGEPFKFLKFRSMYVDADARLAELMKHN